jgi:hypothetical protein
VKLQRFLRLRSRSELRNHRSMALGEKLQQLESVLAEVAPASLAALEPGLDDAGVERFQQAVAPFGLPEQLETLYRWHDGGAANVLGTWAFNSLDWVLVARANALSQLGDPPAWLGFDRQNPLEFVGLDVPGTVADASVWSGWYDDDKVQRDYDSIETLVDTSLDLFASSEFEVLESGWISWRLDELGVEPFRLARNPTSFKFTYPAPWRPGTTHSHWPSDDWPEAWTQSIGIVPNVWRLKSATHTIAELVTESAKSEVTGRVHVRVGSLDRESGVLEVSDATGTLLVQWNRVVSLLGGSPGQRVEAEITVPGGNPETESLGRAGLMTALEWSSPFG